MIVVAVLVAMRGVVPSVVAVTAGVVVGADAGSKAEAAKKQGKTILDEPQFREAIGAR